MRGRRSRAVALEREIAGLAEHALEAAREAGQAAAPAIQHSAEGLSQVFEKASAALLDSAERFTHAREQRGSGVTTAARTRLADAAERFSESIRPKREHHRIRNVIVAAVAIGGIAALVQSPLRARLTARFLGSHSEEEIPGSITLPTEDSIGAAGFRNRQTYDDAPAPATVNGGDGVGSAPSTLSDAARD
jgi:hypothetical protein